MIQQIKNQLKSTLKQHNVITQARYKMSALEKNIVYMLLAQLKEDDLTERAYKIKKIELEDLTNRSISNEQLRDVTKKLILQKYYLFVDNKIIRVPLLVFASYQKCEGELELKLDKTILPYFSQLKNNYTTFKLDMALRLKSKYSKRIYEMLNQFKDTKRMWISVQELKERLGLIDSLKKEEKYINFHVFEIKVILIAQRELALHTDISFNYTTKKTGKKVTDLEFNIKHTPPFYKQKQSSNLQGNKLLPQATNKLASSTEYKYKKLPLEELRLYKRLQEELGLKNKALCLAVVKNISSGKLERNINQFLEDTKFGKNTITATAYFKSLLNEGMVIEKRETLSKIMNFSKDEKAELVWNRCLDLIKNEVPQTTFKTWFTPIVGLKFENNIITVQVPSEVVYEWVEKHYLQLLTQAITQEIGPEGKLEYVIPR